MNQKANISKKPTQKPINNIPVQNVQNVQRNQSETRSNVDDDTDIVIAATI